ncbi:membrane protein insertase YidC [Streptomyces sp. NRRL S-87]|uniref:YidC/Oxa1 family membrane protein insertase n=1 Tax=Streptomyces sp. NRRL S-87 TaxID=1463920 RepID=UPI00068AC539|nr:membrane protein insertase YidC [Streptomyces sp. NRRL S-87]
MSFFITVVDLLARLLDPLLGASATAAGIVLLTLLVRAGLHPLTRAAFRGERARAALAPRVAELRKRYAGPKHAERLRRELTSLHAEAKVSPFAGLLPMLVQLPVFFVMYRVFSSAEVGGRVNGLLDHRLLSAPLGARWADALGAGGPFGAEGLVFLALFAALAAVAGWNVVRGRRSFAASTAALTSAGSGPGAGSGAGGAGDAGAAGMQRVARWMPLLAFGTLVTAAIVPLAAGLYLLTTTAWSAAERAWLQHRWDARSRAAVAAGA